jgi:hypothetical protein
VGVKLGFGVGTPALYVGNNVGDALGSVVGSALADGFGVG